jgi:hypothetical protein
VESGGVPFSCPTSPLKHPWNEQVCLGTEAYFLHTQRSIRQHDEIVAVDDLVDHAIGEIAGLHPRH